MIFFDIRVSVATYFFNGNSVKQKNILFLA